MLGEGSKHHTAKQRTISAAPSPTDFLARGYLPKELPRVFSSRQLAAALAKQRRFKPTPVKLQGRTGATAVLQSEPAVHIITPAGEYGTYITRPDPNYPNGAGSCDASTPILLVIDPSNPLAGGYAGSINLYGINSALGFHHCTNATSPASGAMVAMTTDPSVTQGTSWPLLYYYKKGSILPQLGTVASSLVIGFPFSSATRDIAGWDQIVTEAPFVINLLDASVDFALGL